MHKEVQALYEAIYRGNVDEVQAFLTVQREKHEAKGYSLLSILNAGLTEKEVQEEVLRLGHKDNPHASYQYEEMGACGYEPGMNPLMMALSLERLEIALLLLAPDLIEHYDLMKLNMYDVTMLHLLLMCSYGDNRYDKNGLASESPEVSADLDDKIKKIAGILIKHTVDFKNPLCNLIAESLFHGQIEIAESLVRLGHFGAPLPSTQQDFNSIKHYFNDIKEGDVKASLEKFKHVKELLSPHYPIKVLQGIDFHAPPPKEVTLTLTSVSDMKSLLSRCTDQKAETLDTIELLKAHIEALHEEGVPLSPKDFESYLENAGKESHEAVKAFLRDEASFPHTDAAAKRR